MLVTNHLGVSLNECLSHYDELISNYDERRESIVSTIVKVTNILIHQDYRM